MRTGDYICKEIHCMNSLKEYIKGSPRAYNTFESVEEFREWYGINEDRKEEIEDEPGDDGKEEDGKKISREEKVVTADKLPVVYADLKAAPVNIFKHIIVFTNNRDPKENKTLNNIYEAIDALKKAKCDIIPKLHVFVAAKMNAEEDESSIWISDGKEEMTIEEESNIDTLVFSRLGVQDEDNCEHIVKLLQDRGFLVLNPVQASALACDKYQSAVLFKKGDIPQPRFCLMTKETLYDEKLYKEAMQEIYPDFDIEDSEGNKEKDVVVKILDGHGGTGVFTSDLKKVYAILQAIFAIDPERELLIQKKEEADGGDIRVHVLTLRDKQVILAAMKRVKLGGDFRSNVSLGAEAEPVRLTPEQEQIALRTATLSHLPWCAVDIMPLVKGSNKEIGDNVVLEINASPGTQGITEVIKHNFVNVLLNELDDPSQFMLQDKTAGFIESCKVTFQDGVSKDFLAKCDTGNSVSVSTLEVGEFEEKGGKISFNVDGKPLTFKVERYINAIAGEVKYKRPVIRIKEVQLGLRKVDNVEIAIVRQREGKTTNMLLNRDILSKLGYIIHPMQSHILTPEMEKVKII